MKNTLRIITVLMLLVLCLTACQSGGTEATEAEEPTVAVTEKPTEAATEKPTQEETSASVTEAEAVTSDKADVSGYLNTDIYASIGDFVNMNDAGATSGIQYENDDITFCAGSDGTITYVSLNTDKYSILGIEVGMKLDDAMAVMDASGAQITESDGTLKHYSIGEYDVGIYSVENPDIVDSVNISLLSAK